MSVSYAFNIAAGSSDDKAYERRHTPQEIKELGARAFASLKILDYSLFVQNNEDGAD